MKTEVTHTPGHTPGPWHVHYDGPYHYLEIETVEQADGKYRHLTNRMPTCSGAPHDEYGVSLSVLADARLMASSPDLLEIVQALADWYDENDGMTGPHAGSVFSDSMTWNDKIHYVLARVREGGINIE